MLNIIDFSDKIKNIKIENGRDFPSVISNQETELYTGDYLGKPVKRQYFDGSIPFMFRLPEIGSGEDRFSFLNNAIRNNKKLYREQILEKYTVFKIGNMASQSLSPGFSDITQIVFLVKEDNIYRIPRNSYATIRNYTSGEEYILIPKDSYLDYVEGLSNSDDLEIKVLSIESPLNRVSKKFLSLEEIKPNNEGNYEINLDNLNINRLDELIIFLDKEGRQLLNYSFALKDVEYKKDDSIKGIVNKQGSYFYKFHEGEVVYNEPAGDIIIKGFLENPNKSIFVTSMKNYRSYNYIGIQEMEKGFTMLGSNTLDYLAFPVLRPEIKENGDPLFKELSSKINPIFIPGDFVIDKNRYFKILTGIDKEKIQGFDIYKFPNNLKRYSFNVQLKDDLLESSLSLEDIIKNVLYFRGLKDWNFDPDKTLILYTLNSEPLNVGLTEEQNIREGGFGGASLKVWLFNITPSNSEKTILPDEPFEEKDLNQNIGNNVINILSTINTQFDPEFTVLGKQSIVEVPQEVILPEYEEDQFFKEFEPVLRKENEKYTIGFGDFYDPNEKLLNKSNTDYDYYINEAIPELYKEPKHQEFEKELVNLRKLLKGIYDRARTAKNIETLFESYTEGKEFADDPLFIMFITSEDSEFDIHYWINGKLEKIEHNITTKEHLSIPRDSFLTMKERDMTELPSDKTLYRKKITINLRKGTKPTILMFKGGL